MLLPIYDNKMHCLSTKQHYDGDVEDLFLDFTVTEELGGKRIVHELRPGGKNISVTNENKLHYVHAMADFKLNRQVRDTVFS
jgi:ubiquitin-protein ligase E3 B